MAIDSKLRERDLVRMKVVDAMTSGQTKGRASVLQGKTQKPVGFEISEGIRTSVATWMKDPLKVGPEFLWPRRFHERFHISTRQYARIVRGWVSSIGLEVTAYGTHSMRRATCVPLFSDEMLCLPAPADAVVAVVPKVALAEEIESVTSQTAEFHFGTSEPYLR